MEFLRDISKGRRDLIKEVELNGNAAFIAKDFFPNSPEAQSLFLLEMKNEITEEQKLRLDELEKEESKKEEKEFEKQNGSEDIEPGGDEK